MENINFKKGQGKVELEVKDLSRDLLEKEVIKLRNQVAKLQSELKTEREPHNIELPPLHLRADGWWEECHSPFEY